MCLLLRVQSISTLCSVETLSWLLMFWCLKLMLAAVTVPVLDRSSERATQIRRAARQALVSVRTTKRGDVPW